MPTNSSGVRTRRITAAFNYCFEHRVRREAPTTTTRVHYHDYGQHIQNILNLLSTIYIYFMYRTVYHTIRTRNRFAWLQCFLIPYSNIMIYLRISYYYHKIEHNSKRRGHDYKIIIFIVHSNIDVLYYR